MAKTISTTTPRGTKILMTSFLEAMEQQPPRWQRASAMEAIARLTTQIKALPVWQEPGTTTAKGARGQRSTKAATPATRRASTTKTTKAADKGIRRTNGTRSTRGATATSSPATQPASSANGASHPEQA
jgi:hypothetical protein